jgi:TonB-linked SusC/RagA family outer membrane protein
MGKLSLLIFSLLVSFSVWSQRTIRGKVIDASGNPLSGVTVSVRGTNTATQTNPDGTFSVSAAQGNTLVFSSVGFLLQEVPVGTNDNLTIALQNQNRELTEVVVTALGIRRSDKALGYSIAKVDPNTITQKSEPDVLKSLQGKVAGVDIRTSQGTPGAATRIQIRGINSFFGNSQPLIIVDGIPYSNDQVTTTNQVTNGGAYSSGIANLDPNDIATINVLKGSSAAALYGSRASNGVILITTKSGSSRRTKGVEITVKSSVSAETIANYPDYQNSFGAGSQQGISNSNGSWGPAFRDLDSIAAWPTLKAAYPELFPTDSVAYRPYPNNVKDLFRTGMVYENSVGFSGGDEKTSFGLTTSQLNHTGYVPNSSFKRVNVGLGGTTKLKIGVNVGANFSYSRSNQSGGFFGENQVGGVASQFARSLFLARNWDLNLPFEDKNGLPLIPNVTGYDNPHWSAKYNKIKTNEERFIAGVHTDFAITKWARVDYNIGTNVSDLSRREITEVGSRAAEGLGQLLLDDYRKQEVESNLLLTLTPTVLKDFSLRTVLGNNINQRTITDVVQTGKQFIAKGIYTLSNTAQQQFTDDYYERRRIFGLFADATIGYKDIAFLNGTVRNDWSSTLPKENRSYLYPSVSGSFVFSDALGLKGKVFDFGKIRAGWAKVGRDADPYQLLDVYTLNPNVLGRPTATLPYISNNPQLKPEFTKELELGTQLSFLQRRIELDFTWYNRKSTNLIAIITTPPSSGYQYKVENFGGISNKGIEVDLTVRPVRSKNFNWDVHGVFTKNKNIVTDLISGVDRIQLTGVLEGINPYLEPGLPFGYLRGTVSARDANGNLLIDPVTGWIITSNDEQMIGDPNPEYKLGITNSFSYKGFTLGFLFDLTKGGQLYSETVNALLGRGVTLDTKDRETSWIIPGVYGDANTGEPLLVNGKTVPNQTVITTNDLYFAGGGGSGSFAINDASEWSIFDATVYRLREATLGYELPKALFKKLPIAGINLSLTGRNLWFAAPGFPKHTNFDPEVNSFGSSSVQGIELSAAPTTRRFGFNLMVTF